MFKRSMSTMVIFVLIFNLVFSAQFVYAQQTSLGVDVDAVTTLGMLKGLGKGVTAEYIRTVPSRLQSAIMFLRLKGLEQDALNFRGIDNFADANSVTWAGGKAIMAYLKAFPQHGWVGDGKSFFPNRSISAKEYYKVMVEALGYRQTVANSIGDFTWDNVLDFARTRGLHKVASKTTFTVADMATATVEALKSNRKGENRTLISSLVDEGALDPTLVARASLQMESFRILSASVTNVNSMILTMAEGTSAILASDRTQYIVTVDNMPAAVTAARYDSATRRVILDVNFSGRKGTVRVNGVIANTLINFTNLRIESSSGIDPINKTFTISLSEYPTISMHERRLLLVRDSLMLNASFVSLNGLEATFVVDSADLSRLVDGTYVLRTPSEDQWITVEGRTAAYPALMVSGVGNIDHTTRSFSVVFTQSPTVSLAGRKLVLTRDGVQIYATFNSMAYLSATFTVDAVDQGLLRDGVYVVSTPTSDRWVTINGRTVSYSSTGRSTSLIGSSYDIATGRLTLFASGLKGVPGIDNDITAAKLTISNGTQFRTLTSATRDVEITDQNIAVLMVAGEDKIAVDQILVQNGYENGIGGFYNIAAAIDWNGVGTPADLTANYIDVVGHPHAYVNSVSYDCSSGVLLIDGGNFKKVSGPNNDVNPSRITIMAVGGVSYTLTNATPGAEIINTSSAAITISGRDRAEVNTILNAEGSQNNIGLRYDIHFHHDWNGYSTPPDATNNTLVVSNYAGPTLTGAAYNYDTGVLTLQGTGFRAIPGANNDITVSRLTLSAIGGASYTLTANTSNHEVTSGTTAVIQLGAADRLAISAIFDKEGTQNSADQLYNIAAGINWNGTGSLADLTGNPVNVVGFTTPTINNGTYNFSTGVLTIYGSNFKTVAGPNNDINASRFAVSAVNGASYTLTANTPNVDIVNATTVHITLGSIDRAEVNGILTSNGSQNPTGQRYNIAAFEDWNGPGSAEDISDNGLSVVNWAAPAITSAVYNAATGALTLTGTSLRRIAGANNDVTVNRLTISAGSGNSYTLTAATPNAEVTNDTTAVITIGAADRTDLNSIFTANGTQSAAGHAYNLSAAADWNGSGTPVDSWNSITVVNWASPTITGAAYNVASGVLTLTGTGIRRITGPNNDITAVRLTISDGSASYTLTNTADVEAVSDTTAVLTLSAGDRNQVNTILLRDGVDNGSGGVYNIAAAAGWNGVGSLVDLTGNPITVSGHVSATITSAAYNFATGALTLTGAGFKSVTGPANDMIAERFTINDGVRTYTLTGATSNVEIINDTTAVLNISGIDRAGAAWVLTSNGNSNGGAVFNLSAAEGWNGAGSLADLTGNPITVSNYAPPTITAAAYDCSTGILTLTGSNLRIINGTNNDVDVTRLTLQAGAKSYTLTGATPNVDLVDAATIRITINGIDRAGANSIFTLNGTSSSDGAYNLAAALNWNGVGAAAVNATAITASNWASPAITSATYNSATGALVITGTSLRSRTGPANDIDVTRLTIGAGLNTYTLTAATANPEVSSDTMVVATIAGMDKAYANAIFIRDGSNNGNFDIYNLAAAAGWNDAGSDADTAGNIITVSNYVHPNITNATYNFSTGVLRINGTGFRSISGPSDIFADRLTITDGGKSYTLTGATGNVKVVDDTLAILTIAGIDRAGVNWIFVRNGDSNGLGGNYRINAALNWNGVGTDPDSSGNVITVSNYDIPTITSATYNAVDGVLTILGSNLRSVTGPVNDVAATRLTVSNGTQSHTISAATPNGELDISNPNRVAITLSSADRIAVNNIFDKNGTDDNKFNLSAEADWNGTGAPADLNSNIVTVSGY